MRAPPLSLSIVVPVLNEAPTLATFLGKLQPLRANGHGLVLVDGGSTDTSAAIALPLCDRLVLAPAGRANQMNAGSQGCAADVLLFLHADTDLPANAAEQVLQAVAHGAVWGRFDVSIAGRSRWLPMVAAFMNMRSRLTGIATGDQAIFVRRASFESIGGYSDMPLMEDIDLSKRLRALAWPVCLRARVQTAGRRWDERGVWRTIVLMWRLRWRYWRGAPIQQIAKAYQ
jgi:rSAM/selenodomain-associated transferase 2